MFISSFYFNQKLFIKLRCQATKSDMAFPHELLKMIVICRCYPHIGVKKAEFISYFCPKSFQKVWKK